MKILCWTAFFLPDIGGTEVLLAKVLPKIQRLNYEFIVVTSHGKYKLNDETVYNGVPIYRFKFRDALSNGNLRLMLKIRQQITRLKKSFKPDLVHVHVSDPSVYFHINTDSAFPVPTIVTFHQNLAYFGLNTNKGTLIRQVISMANWITAVSQATLKGIHESMPEIKDRSSVICNGMDPLDLFPEPLSFVQPRILFVGRLIHQKGLDIAIRAFGTLRYRFPRARFTIAGDGPIRSDLEQLATTLGMSDFIEFKGRIDPETVPALMNSATMVVMPSRTEGLPMVALEAAQMARPVIATSVGGLSEVVLHQETGLIIEKENTQALADAIAYILDNPDLASHMGQAARLRALQVFSLENYINSYDRLYRKIIQAENKPLAMKKEQSS
jgi:glycogen(starch) synthase